MEWGVGGWMGGGGGGGVGVSIQAGRPLEGSLSIHYICINAELLNTCRVSSNYNDMFYFCYCLQVGMVIKFK